MNTIAWLGRLVIERIKGIGAASLMLIQILFSAPSKGGFQRFIYQMHRVGVMSLLIIAVSGLFIGAVLGLQMYSILVTFGSEAMLGTAISLTLLRELAAVVAALLFAGRAGSALTAEIGSMKQSEQLASMEMIGQVYNVHAIFIISSPVESGVTFLNTESVISCFTSRVPSLL